MSLLENAKGLAGGLESGILRPEEKPMTNLLENCKRLDYSPDQPRDENGRFGEGPGAHRMTGKTYPAKDVLKSAGYKYHEPTRSWVGEQAQHDELTRITSPTYSRTNANATAGLVREDLPEHGKDYAHLFGPNKGSLVYRGSDTWHGTKPSGESQEFADAGMTDRVIEQLNRKR